MSIARGDFLRNLAGISEAIGLEPLAQGATNTIISPGMFVLRRGILVASLIALETFIRERTSEALRALERWPKSFEDLPEKLRLAARMNALSHLQQFARMLRRQGEDFETELWNEIEKMASGHGTVQQFSKFVSGDHTGNLSDENIKDLLSNLQVKDCWASFRVFSSDAGIGVPSVQEVVKNIVRRRHRSAHSASYSPTATDITGLRTDLLCVAMCFDVSVSASMEQSLSSSDDWANGNCDWRAGVNLYTAKPCTGGLRLMRFGRQRALRVVRDLSEAKNRIPRAAPGHIAVLVEHDSSGRPVGWDIM
jgi:hypothetical protein